MHDGQGPVLRYVEDLREGTPIADLATVVQGRSARDAALAAMRGLPERLVATSDMSLADALLIEGAKEKRHSFVMQCDLRAHPADAPDAAVDLVPWPTLDDPKEWSGILPCWRQAFPETHPDHFSGDDQTAIAFLLGLISGAELGPMHRSSTLVHDSPGTSIAGMLVTIRPQDRPFGGPWITDLWCDPHRHGSGVGHRLMNHAKRLLTDDGYSSLYLSVTASNPARQRYEREGFQSKLESWTLALPKSRT